MATTVTIMSERKVALPVSPGVSREFIAVTYSTPTQAPRIVYIDADKDTQEERKLAIAADLQTAAAGPAKTLDLP